MTFTDYLQEILRQFASALMVPAMVILALLVLLALFFLGSLIVEYFTERRLAKQSLPDAINAVERAEFAELDQVIVNTQLLWSQKAALLMVVRNAGLPADALFALAKGQVQDFERRYRKLAGYTDLMAKVAPMMGLVCTLVPLGPGIVAMGQGDMNTLSSSLGVAFDGTVAGLVSAMAAMCISHVRKRWYSGYQAAVEALMTAVLEKADACREAGEQLPCGFTAAELEPYKAAAKEALQAAGAAAKAPRGQKGEQR
ncbi:MAG: MotA/TolQ/ExbB proton channel family protein [Coriobacteriales bacterium]